jgi:hypothetical protein
VPFQVISGWDGLPPRRHDHAVAGRQGSAWRWDRPSGDRSRCPRTVHADAIVVASMSRISWTCRSTNSRLRSGTASTTDSSPISPGSRPINSTYGNCRYVPSPPAPRSSGFGNGLSKLDRVVRFSARSVPVMFGSRSSTSRKIRDSRSLQLQDMIVSQRTGGADAATINSSTFQCVYF